MATERQLPGPIAHHPTPGMVILAGNTARLLGIFDMASLKGEHSYLGKNSKSCDHENTIVVRRIENQQSHRRRGIMRREGHRDSGFEKKRRTERHLRGECYFSGRSPDISRTVQDHTQQQVITR